MSSEVNASVNALTKSVVSIFFVIISILLFLKIINEFRPHPNLRSVILSMNKEGNAKLSLFLVTSFCRTLWPACADLAPSQTNSTFFRNAFQILLKKFYWCAIKIGKLVVFTIKVARLGLNNEENFPLPNAPITRNKFFLFRKYLKSSSDGSPVRTIKFIWS